MTMTSNRPSRLSALALGISLLAISPVAPGAAFADEASAAPAHATEQIPAAEFVKKGNMRTPRVSPDGKHLAYLAASGGKEVLVVIDLDNPSKPPRPILAAEEVREAGDRTMSGFRWIGNDHVVMTIVQRENFFGRLGDMGRLVAYSLSSGKMVQQAWDKSGFNASRILWVNHDTGEYLLQRDTVGDDTERQGLPEVVRVKVATGDYSITQRTNPMVTAGWAADADGVVRAGFSSNRDNGKIKILYRSNANENFRTVYNAADKTFTETLPEPKMFIPGTDKAYVITNKDGFDKAYTLDMNTLALSEPIFETPGFDLQDILTDADGRKLVGYATFDGSNRAHYVDPHRKEILGFLEELLGAGEVRIASADRKGERLVVFAGGVTRGIGYYLYDVPTAKISLLNWYSNSIKDAPLNHTKAEWITASDGVKIQVMVTYPRHRKGKNLPIVIMPHGGPFGILTAANDYDPWSQALAEAGYLVVQPNYRGSGGYGKEFLKLGRAPGGYGKRMQDDLTDTLNAYAAKGLADAKRACIMGWSYGGYAAGRGAQRDPGLWRCAIAGAGVYDFPLMHKYTTNNLGSFIRGFQATSDDPQGISPALHADAPWAPILVVAAERDATIPMEQSKSLMSAFKKAGKVEGKDFRYVVQPKGTHNLPYDDVHIEWIEESLAWLERFNPAYVSSDSDKAPPKAAIK